MAKSNLRGQLTTKQKSLFHSKAKLFTESGRVSSPYREMTIGNKISSGVHAKKTLSTNWFTDRRQMEMPLNYKGTGTIKRLETRKTRDNWEAFPSGSGFVKLNSKEFPIHLIMVSHQIGIAMEHWRLAIANRALAVFQESFKLKKFNSADGKKWKKNTRWTWRKRLRKGTWPGAGRLMQETNKLYKSLHVVNGEPFVGVKASCRYAGIHNNPRPGETYGNGFGGKYFPPKPVTRRQFMGHSTKIDEFILMYESRYLFDSVFRRRV